MECQPFPMFLKMWENFNLHSCVAPDGFKNSVCAPWPKKFVHHWCNGSDISSNMCINSYS